MNIVKLSPELFDKPEGTASLTIYRSGVYFSSDAEKALGTWYGYSNKSYYYDPYIDKDDPKTIFFSLNTDIEIHNSKHTTRLLPSFYTRFVYERLNIDINHKLVFSMIPKPIIFGGSTLYKFELVRVESIQPGRSTQVDVNINLHTRIGK